MATTTYRPYTQPARSPLQTLARPRRSAPPSPYGATRTPGYRTDATQGYDTIGPGHTFYPADPGGGGGSVTDLRNQPADYHNAPAPGYENDPVYQQIKALAQQSVADAEAQATASRKQLAIGLGDPGLANSLHLGADTAYAAQNNPYSTLANLLRGHVGNVKGINSGTNAANLFFSSQRGKELGAEQTGYGGQRADAASQAQGVLSQIAAYLLAAKRQAAQSLLGAQGDWYHNHKDDPLDPGTVALYALRNLQGGTYSAEDVNRLSPTTVLRLLSG